MLRRVEADKDDAKSLGTAKLLFETATLRSGFILEDQIGFAERIEAIIRQNLDVDADAAVSF